MKTNLIKKKYKLNDDDLIRFESNAKRYIKSIRDGRMLCIIDSVSSSGMSRTLKFVECNGKAGNYHYYNFYWLFDNLGYQKVKNSDLFRVFGCGMDMVFATNYNIIYTFKNLGLITNKTADNLSQKTPHTV
jgi:hypothetical protein